MSILLGGAYLAQYVVPGGPAGSTVTLTVTAPDATVTTPAVTTGAVCTATVPALQAGTYLLVWSTTGAVVDVQQDQVTVDKPGLDLVSLGDLRDDLNISSASTAMNAKLRRYLKAATYLVENITGPILPATRTDVFDGDNTFLVLPFRWVQSITDLHETRGITNYVLTEQPLGQSVNAFGYTWDRTINKVVRRSYGGAIATFAPGTNTVSITYVLGMATIPDDIQTATIELVRHWWQFGQQPFKGPFSSQPVDDGGVASVVGYAVPNRVLELLNPWRRHPGIF